MSSLTDDDRLDALDDSTRAGLVRAAVGDSDAVMRSWEVSTLPGGAAGANFRACGEALSRSRVLPWSLVVKWFSPLGDESRLPANVDPSSLGYWKREWLLYQAPWFGERSWGLAAPRVLGAGETSSTDAWLAMEDLSPFDQRPWSLWYFAAFARQAGRFNGAFLAGHRLPTAPWLCQHWLRDWSAVADPITVLDATKDDPAVGRVFTEAMVAELGWLWRTREALLQALDALPQTLCHGDLHPRNAFFRPTSEGDQAVAIDWSYCGLGPVGADLAGLVGSSMFLLEAEQFSPDELESQCLDGYLAGLRDLGWRGSELDVRFGYLASLTIRFSISFTELVVGLVVSDKDHAWGEKILGRTIDEFLTNYRTMLDFLEPRVEELRQAERTR